MTALHYKTLGLKQHIHCWHQAVSLLQLFFPYLTKTTQNLHKGWMLQFKKKKINKLSKTGQRSALTFWTAPNDNGQEFSPIQWQNVKGEAHTFMLKYWLPAGNRRCVPWAGSWEGRGPGSRHPLGECCPQPAELGSSTGNSACTHRHTQHLTNCTVISLCFTKLSPLIFSAATSCLCWLPDHGPPHDYCTQAVWQKPKYNYSWPPSPT